MVKTASPTASEQYAIAREIVAGGISVIPIRLDGSKQPFWSRLPTVDQTFLDPSLPEEQREKLSQSQPGKRKWVSYQYRLPTEKELHRFFLRSAGIGMCTGVASGGMEVIDFDENADEIFHQWKESLSREIRGKLCVVETGGLGFHVLYRCERIGGNFKLAMDVESKITFIETRGQGGYVVGVGSPLEVHAGGYPYVQVAGAPLPELPTMTPDERKELFVAAARFDQRQRVLDVYAKKRARALTSPVDDLDLSKPWNDFDVNGSWSDILRPAGWSSSDGKRWVRPGKRGGISAVVVPATNGCEVLTVFSSNAGALAPISGSYKSWGKTSALAALCFGGDRSAACKQILKEGFGKRSAAK